MRYIKDDRKFYIIILILFLFLLFWGARFFLKPDKVPVVKEEINYKEVVKEINQAYKTTMLLSGEEQEEAMAKAAPRSLHAWGKFVAAFKDKQPVEYKRTRDWDRKLIKILGHERRADELVKENNFAAARQETEMAGKIFKKIKEENGILDISDEMLSFYEVAKKVIEAETREDVRVNIQELKFRFTILKEYNINNQYNKLIFKMEKLIGDLDKLLDGPDFRKAQSELEPVFMELYLAY